GQSRAVAAHESGRSERCMVRNVARLRWGVGSEASGRLSFHLSFGVSFRRLCFSQDRNPYVSRTRVPAAAPSPLVGEGWGGGGGRRRSDIRRSPAHAWNFDGHLARSVPALNV